MLLDCVIATSMLISCIWSGLNSFRMINLALLLVCCLVVNWGHNRLFYSLSDLVLCTKSMQKSNWSCGSEANPKKLLVAHRRSGVSALRSGLVQ